MALIHVDFYAESLGMSRSMDVIIPQEQNGVGQGGSSSLAKGDIPVLYLLHGGSDDHTMWQRRTSIERYALSKGLAVIMPSTDMGCYTDMKYGYDFFRFYSQELPEIVREFFPCLSTRREKTFVAGQSMGGYGALKLGISCPERFSRVAALSAMTKPEGLFDNLPDAAATIWGSREEIKGTVNDLYHSMELLLKSGKQLPEFYLICGTEDFLYEDDMEFYTAWKDRVNLTAHWEPGTHEWGFWDRNIQRVLDWLPLSAKQESQEGK